MWSAHKFPNGRGWRVVRVKGQIIPDCTDSNDNIQFIANFALELGGVEINLLHYHRLGLGKYKALGMKYGLE